MDCGRAWGMWEGATDRATATFPVYGAHRKSKFRSKFEEVAGNDLVTVSEVGGIREIRAGDVLLGHMRLMITRR
jgi:hypothetical protein